MKDFLVVAILAPLVIAVMVVLTPRCASNSRSVEVGGWLVSGCPSVERVAQFHPPY